MYSFSTWPTTADRNNFAASTGFFFTPAATRRVTRVGRLYVVGNTQNHLIEIWNNTTHALITSATILAASTSDSNGFKWVTLASPFTWNAATPLAATSEETNTGDTWKDLWDAASSINSAELTIGGYAYGAQGSWPSNQGAGTQIYNTVAFEFAPLGGGPSRLSMGLGLGL